LHCVSFANWSTGACFWLEITGNKKRVKMPLLSQTSHIRGVQVQIHSIIHSFIQSLVRSFIHNLGAKRRRQSMPQPIYTMGRNPVLIEPETKWAPEPVWAVLANRKSLIRIEERVEHNLWIYIILVTSCSFSLQNQITWYGHVQRMVEGRLPKIALKWMPKQKRARRRPKKNWMEGIRKAMNERNLNECQWEDRKQWSLGVGQRRKEFWNRYIYIYIVYCMYSFLE